MDKIADLLQQLANKLGVSVNTLWGFYIKQQRVEAIMDTISFTLCFSVVVLVLWLSIKHIRPIYKDDGELAIGFGIGALVVVALFTSFSMSFAHDAVSEIYNPGYGAFHQLTSDMKGVLGH